jgi:hypothetical protein
MKKFQYSAGLQHILQQRQLADILAIDVACLPVLCQRSKVTSSSIVRLSASATACISVTSAITVTSATIFFPSDGPLPPAKQIQRDARQQELLEDNDGDGSSLSSLQHSTANLSRTTHTTIELPLSAYATPADTHAALTSAIGDLNGTIVLSSTTNIITYNANIGIGGITTRINFSSYAVIPAAGFVACTTIIFFSPLHRERLFSRVSNNADIFVISAKNITAQNFISIVVFAISTN